MRSAALTLCLTAILTTAHANTACTHHPDFNSYTCGQSTSLSLEVFHCPDNTINRSIDHGTSNTHASLKCTDSQGKSSYFSCKNKHDHLMTIRHVANQAQPGYLCLANPAKT